MMWTAVLTTFRENVAEAIARRRKREMEPKDSAKGDAGSGGVLSEFAPKVLTSDQEFKIANDAFQELWKENKTWMRKALHDALAFAQSNRPRDHDTIESTLRPGTFICKSDDSAIGSSFAQAWQSLKNRGWKATLLTEGDKAGKTKYEYGDQQVSCAGHLSVQRGLAICILT
jgi:hypothetical protein